MRLLVSTTSGGASARNTPSSGTVICQSDSTSSRYASNSSSARSISSIEQHRRRTARRGSIARSSARLTRKRSLVQLGLEGVGRPAGGLAAGLGGAQVEELAAVVPVVDGLGGVDALVALQADQLAAGPRRQHLGHLGLADAGLALEQQRPAQRHGQEHRRRQPLVGQVAVRRQGRRDVVDRLRLEDPLAHAGRLPSAVLAGSVPRRCPPSPFACTRPAATSVTLVRFSDDGSAELDRRPLERDGDHWVGEVAEGTVYGLVADGDGGRFDPSKVLLDPSATEVCVPAGPRPPSREQALASPNSGRRRSPGRRPWPAPRPPRRSSRRPVVYEAHVRGMTVAKPATAAPGTFRALIGELDRIAALGVTVLELLPVHQNDPAGGQLLGLHAAGLRRRPPPVRRRRRRRRRAGASSSPPPTTATSRCGSTSSSTTRPRSTPAGPTYSFRGLADGDYYRLDADGSYIETTGCGNDIDASSPAAQDLIVMSLDRFADLGVDGFRFDLAAGAQPAPAVRRPARRVGDCAAACG